MGKFNKVLLPDLKEFYISLNMCNITDVNCKHAKRVWQDFQIKNSAEYQDLYVQSNTLLPADIFGNFQNKCIEIYELDYHHFLPVSGSAWKTAFEKTKVKSELLSQGKVTRFQQIHERLCFKKRIIISYVLGCK